MHTRIIERYNRHKAKRQNALTNQKVGVALVQHAYSQTSIGLLTSIACATIILFAFNNIAEFHKLILWYGQFIIIIVIRFAIAKIYLHQRYPEKNIALWRNLFILSALLGGSSWGISGILLFPYGSHLQQALIVFILSGMTAGAVPLLSAIRSAASAFLIPAGLPLLIHFYVMHNEIFYLFDLALALYLSSMIILSFKIHHLIENTIFLKFQNDELVKDLINASEKLEYAASHDPLTQVANRNLFEINFTKALRDAKKEKKLLALLYIDLDNFKGINDQYGHHVGDELLLATVKKIKKILSTPQLIARLGGDEFTIILEDSSIKQIADTANRICFSLNEPLKLNNLEVTISASIGISLYPHDGKDISTLLRAADKAMYVAKQQGSNKFHFNTVTVNIPE